MRPGFALVLPFVRVVLITGAVLFGFWWIARVSLPPGCLCPTDDSAGYAVEEDGCLEWCPLPVPRFGTNPDGSTWRLEDLKPGSELRDMDLRGADWRGVHGEPSSAVSLDE